MNISLSPLAPENLVSRDGFGSPVPRLPFRLHNLAESGAYLRDSSRFPRRRLFLNLNRRTPSGQTRVYRVTQLRIDGVHCRESAGTGPVDLNVVPNGYCLWQVTKNQFWQVTKNQLICASLFPHINSCYCTPACTSTNNKPRVLLFFFVHFVE